MSEQKTHAEIVAEMRNRAKRPDFVSQDVLKSCADELDLAHKREVDALKQRCAELSAEVAAKDEVIKRLDDAIAEEQRRKLATTENSSAVGNAAKCPATPMTLDEAIAHCDECSDSTPCGRQHKQLGDWLRQLRGLREHSNAAKLREALEAVRDAHFVREENGEDCEGFDVEADDGTGRPLICVVEDALAAPPRNCDRYSHDEALQVWASEEGNERNGCFDEWLYEIAKDGGAK